MLTREALESALPLTMKFDEAGLKIEPVLNSPLAALVAATRSGPEFFIASNGPDMGTQMGQQSGDVRPDLETISYMANCKNAAGICEHDVAHDELVQVIGDSILDHLKIARTVVAPVVEDLAERTLQSLNEITPSSLLGVEVVVCDPPAPLMNNMLESSVIRFDRVAYDNPALNFNMPDFTAAELREFCMTGTNRLDDDISVWLAERGDAFLLTVWEQLFQRKVDLDKVPGRSLTFSDVANSTTEEGEHGSLAVYLLARKLADEVPEGVEMNASAYEDLMVQFRNQAALRLCHILDRHKDVVKTGLLIKTIKDKRLCFVNGDVYRQWIENGGEVEILFGNLLQSPPLVTVEQLTARGDALKLQWNNHAGIAAAAESNRRFNRSKELLGQHFRRQLQEDSDETTKQAAADILRRFEDLLSDVNENDILDLYETCLKLVCRSRFPTTDAEGILRGIAVVKKANPNVDIRECAAVAEVTYIARWAASMFKVTSL